MIKTILVEGTFRSVSGSEGKERDFANCICSCGSRFVAQLKSVRSGNTTSCGCKRKATLRRILTKHGETSRHGGSKELRAYYGIRKRCHNPKDCDYHNYGGRGIEIKFASFEGFLSCIGRAPSSAHSVDRIDINGHYEKGNVRWATPSEQSNNTRKTLRIVIDGETRTLAEWCQFYDIPKYQYFNRRRLGFSTREIFERVKHVRN